MVPDSELGASVQEAIEALKRGEVVCVYDADGREEETDLTIASQFATEEKIRQLRKDGGGLVCTTMTPAIADRFGIPFLVDIYAKAIDDYPILKAMVPNDIPYDAKSSFAVTVNARDTFTGITDIDRANTIASFAKVIEETVGWEQPQSIEKFGSVFRCPGHVHLLVAHEGLTKTRQGHTELCTALVVMAGLVGSATICEMMSDTGKARDKASAESYANERGHVFISGKDIIDAWETWSE